MEEVAGKTAQVQRPVVVEKSGQGVAAATQPQPQKEEQRPVGGEGQAVPLHKVQRAVDSINKALEVFNVERRFIIHQKTHQVMVKITDKQTGEVIMEIPPEEALERYEKMQEFIGLLFNEKV